MTREQQGYIEDNIGLIETSDWEEFFKNAPWGIGYVLYKAGVDFMTQLGYVPKEAFHTENIQTIVLPDNITSIGDYAFYNCKNLTSVTIPDSVISIDISAFERCPRLTSLTIGNGVTSIGNYAFQYCRSLTSITIPDSVISIGDHAFDVCDGLTSLTIPNNVTIIGKYAFRDCKSLTSIIIPDSVTSIGHLAFCNCGKLEIKYHGTKADWRALISSSRDVFKYTTYICKCTDGIVKKSR